MYHNRQFAWSPPQPKSFTARGRMSSTCGVAHRRARASKVRLRGGDHKYAAVLRRFGPVLDEGRVDVAVVLDDGGGGKDGLSQGEVDSREARRRVAITVNNSGGGLSCLSPSACRRSCRRYDADKQAGVRAARRRVEGHEGTLAIPLLLCDSFHVCAAMKACVHC